MKQPAAKQPAHGYVYSKPNQVLLMVERLSYVPVPQPLVDVMMDLTSRGVARVSDENVERIEIYTEPGIPFRDIATLSDLNLTPLTRRYAKMPDGSYNPCHNSGWYWKHGYPLRKRPLALFGADAASRFAEISEMPLVDFMAVMGAVDAGAQVMMIAVFIGKREITKGIAGVGLIKKAFMGYEWRLVVEDTPEAAGYMRSIDWADDRHDGWEVEVYSGTDVATATLRPGRVLYGRQVPMNVIPPELPGVDSLPEDER